MSPGQLADHYDPLKVFSDVFSASDYGVDELGDHMTCLEVNVLIALLEHCGEDEAARRWFDRHATTCAEPARHHH